MNMNKSSAEFIKELNVSVTEAITRCQVNRLAFLNRTKQKETAYKNVEEYDQTELFNSINKMQTFVEEVERFNTELIRSVLVCNICDELCANSEAIEKHFEIVHMPVIVESQNIEKINNNDSSDVTMENKKIKVKCKVCAIPFTKKNNYKLHLQRMHPDLPEAIILNKCKLCLLKCDDFSALQNHYINVHNSLLCLVCQKVMEDKVNLLLHIEAHNDINIQCDPCKIEFLDDVHLNRHFLYEHIYCNIFKFNKKNVIYMQCKLCEATFTYNDEFKNIYEHIKQHFNVTDRRVKELPVESKIRMNISTKNGVKVRLYSVPSKFNADYNASNAKNLEPSTIENFEQMVNNVLKTVNKPTCKVIETKCDHNELKEESNDFVSQMFVKNENTNCKEIKNELDVILATISNSSQNYEQTKNTQDVNNAPKNGSNIEQKSNSSNNNVKEIDHVNNALKDESLLQSSKDILKNVQNTENCTQHIDIDSDSDIIEIIDDFDDEYLHESPTISKDETSNSSRKRSHLINDQAFDSCYSNMKKIVFARVEKAKIFEHGNEDSSKSTWDPEDLLTLRNGGGQDISIEEEEVCYVDEAMLEEMGFKNSVADFMREATHVRVEIERLPMSLMET